MLEVCLVRSSISAGLSLALMQLSGMPWRLFYGKRKNLKILFLRGCCGACSMVSTCEQLCVVKTATMAVRILGHNRSSVPSDVAHCTGMCTAQNMLHTMLKVTVCSSADHLLHRLVHASTWGCSYDQPDWCSRDSDFCQAAAQGATRVSSQGLDSVNTTHVL